MMVDQNTRQLLEDILNDMNVDQKYDENTREALIEAYSRMLHILMVDRCIQAVPESQREQFMSTFVHLTNPAEQVQLLHTMLPNFASITTETYAEFYLQNT